MRQLQVFLLLQPPLTPLSSDVSIDLGDAMSEWSTHVVVFATAKASFESGIEGTSTAARISLRRSRDAVSGEGRRPERRAACRAK